MAAGLMYHPGTVNSCFNAIEGTFLAWDTSLDVIIKLYLPWYWADFQVTIQDTVSMMSDFYSSCDIDKLFTTLTKLITVEGISELASRAVGAIFFEYKDLVNAFKKDEVTKKLILSSYEIGYYFGRAISVTFAWTI